MNKISSLFPLTFSVFFATATMIADLSHAIQEFETVVTDQKFNSSSTIVIDKEEIEKSRTKNLTTLLASQANISISQSNFQPNSIFLRGGDSSHVLILIDGIPAYDSATLQRTMNLNTINLKSIERIEVIKGSQSVLYGGHALSGIIKIDTVPQDLKNGGQITGHIGSHQSRLLAVSGIRTVSDTSAIVVRASMSDRNNGSPVLNSDKVYPTRLGTADLGYIKKSAEWDSFFKVGTAFDKTFIASTDNNSRSADADDFESSTYNLNFSGKARYVQSLLAPTLIATFQKSARNYEQQFVTSPTKREYSGDLAAIRGEMYLLNRENFKLSTGLNYLEEKVVYRDANRLKSNEKSNFSGAYLKTDYNPAPEVKLEAGIRRDVRRSQDPFTTYQVGATFYEKVKFEYATGARYPSVSQLTGSYGNPNLKPERSKSTSVSVEHNWTPDFFNSITLFDNYFENLMVARGMPPVYQNISNSKTQGFELTTGLRFTEARFFVNLSLGYQEPKDLDTNNWLAKRPLRSASLKLRKETDNFGFGTEVVHSGDRRDVSGFEMPSFTSLYSTIPSYTYLNATAEYKSSETLSYFVRGQNLTDVKYETAYSFYDEGQSYVIGAEATF